MRRLARWTLNALTVLSLVLCVAIVGLSVWSGRISHALWFQTYGGVSIAVVSHDRLVVVSFGQVDDLTLSMSWAAGIFWHSFEPNGYGVELADQQGGTILSHLGFVSANTEIPTAHTDSGFAPFTTSMESVHAVYLPHALLVLLMGWLPTRWCVRTAVAHKRSKRRSNNQCPHCSYDLTGNVSGVCSECGTAVAALRPGPASRETVNGKGDR